MPKAYWTYRISVANYDRVQVQKWNDKNQSLGEPSGIFRYQDKLAEITPMLATARNNELKSPSQTRAIGEVLFEILFDDRLLQDFVNFYHLVVQQEKQLLRVELDIDEQGMPEIAALPWEFMCVPTRAKLGTIWLGTVPDLAFSRRRSQWIPATPIQLQKDEKLRIALAISAPQDPDLSSVAYEPVQEALEKLALELADRVELLPILKSANPETVDAVLAKKPHIFHFIGHGRLVNENNREIGQIAFVDPYDGAMWVDADYFSELFNQHRPGVVMLQACERGSLSASQAFVGVASGVVQQNIPVVVAMQYIVTNITASQFSRQFYQKLAEGYPVDIAAQYGRREIALGPMQYRKRDFATPVIFMRVPNGYLFSQQKVEAESEKSDSIPLLPKELPQEEYIRLKTWLAAGRWQEANDLTRIIILKAAKAEKEGWLSEEQIQNFSCQVLKVIDGLWLQYSDRRFGFSVQKRISKECEKNSQAFGDRVGWCVKNTWISASEVTYTPANAPEGHLPWGVMPVITMDNAALNSFVKGLRSGTKAVIGSDWQKLQLIADFMGFVGFLTGETVDKEEFKRNMECQLSHEEALWEGNRLEELKVRKLFSLLEASPNL